MVDQPPEVNVTKQALQETLSGTQYDHRGIVNGLHLVLGNGLDQLHTSAICISLVCLSFTRDNTIQPANEETRDPKELLPRGSNIFPTEIAILLKAIDEDDKNTTKDYAFDVFNNPNVTRDSHQLRFVTRREFNDHIKQFKFHDKWLNVCSKIENVVGISNKKICEDTMLRYLRSFLSVVTWLNKTDKLCPSRDFTVNINNSEVCGTYYENYFYEQVQVRKEITDEEDSDEEETDEEETDEQFIDRKQRDFNLEFGVAIKTAHLYLGDKKLRQLIGTEKSITAALNLGCARNYGNTTREVIKESSVLVVGLIDYLSDFCMERVKAMQSIVDKSDCHKVFTIGSRPIEDLCWLDTNKFPDQLQNNLFHEWDSPIMFPSLAHKFDNNTHFDRLYVDHFVDDDMSSFRGSSMRDFYEQMLPELCSANLITDTSKAYIPFTSETIYALHASWSTVCKYATIKFVDKCAWSRFTNTKDSIGLLMEIENKPNRKKVKKDVGEKLTTITKNITTGLSLMNESRNKRKRGNDNRFDKKAFDSLERAKFQWNKCTDTSVGGIGWIKMQFKMEPGESKHIIDYPFSKAPKKNVMNKIDDVTVSTMTLKCNLKNVKELSEFLEINERPTIILAFNDTSTTRVKNIAMSDSLLITGEEEEVSQFNRRSHYTTDQLANHTPEELDELTQNFLHKLITQDDDENESQINIISRYSQDLLAKYSLQHLDELVEDFMERLLTLVLPNTQL